MFLGRFPFGEAQAFRGTPALLHYLARWMDRGQSMDGDAETEGDRYPGVKPVPFVF